MATGGRNKNRWFKFNDTTVEDFEMTDENIMNECFGGSYKVAAAVTLNRAKHCYLLCEEYQSTARPLICT